MERSNWAKAEAARVQAVTDSAESEIRARTDACNMREPRLPAPTMVRCSFPFGHGGRHSFEPECPNCHATEGIAIDIHHEAWCSTCGHEWSFEPKETS